MRTRLMLLIVLLVAPIARAGWESPPIPPRVEMDRHIFKGRLIGVSFGQQLDLNQRRLYMQFLETESYAMIGIADNTVQRVATEVSVNLKTITPGNYVTTINNALPEPLQLGGEVIIIAHWPGAQGMELLDVRPADADTERALLDEFREYILQVRLMQTGSRARVCLVRLRTTESAIREVQHFIDTSPGMTSEERDALQPKFEEYVLGCRAQCRFAIEAIREERQSLRAELRATDPNTGELERKYLQSMLDYLDTLEAFTASQLKRIEDEYADYAPAGEFDGDDD